jgi:hypothetical protein
MSLRDTLNDNNLNQAEDALSAISLGELLTLLIKNSTATEAGLVPAADQITLAATPTALFQINATAGAVTGVKRLRKGPITGSGAIVPATGEAVWDGGTKVLFASVDAVTAASVLYAKSTDKASILLRDLTD